MKQAVEQGYDEIQHMNFLFLNFMRDVTETRTPARFTSVAERGADLDLQSTEVRTFIDLLKRRSIVSDPPTSAIRTKPSIHRKSPRVTLSLLVCRFSIPAAVSRPRSAGSR